MSIQALICGFKSAIVDYLAVHNGNKVLSSENGAKKCLTMSLFL